MTKKTTPGTEKKTAKGKKNQTTAKTNLRHINEDKRTDHRIPIQLLVDYRANGNYLFDFCRDLGVGGVFIQTKVPLPAGSNIDLVFTIPDSKETLATKGEVIWVQPEVTGREDLSPGMGVQFTSFSGDQRKRLEEYISRFHSSTKTTSFTNTHKNSA